MPPTAALPDHPLYLLLHARGHPEQKSRVFAYIIDGVVRSLRASIITVEQAEHDVFRLHIYLAAKEAGLDRRVMEAMEWGMQLDDVFQLAPDGIADSFDTIQRLCEEVIAEGASTKAA